MAGTGKLEEALAEVPLLAGLTRKDRRSVARMLREETFEAGDEVVTQGEVSGRCFVVLDGRAKVVVNGRTRRTLQPGAFIGELSLLDNGPRSATVRAETRLRTASMSSTTFYALLAEHWPMTRVVLTVLARRIRDLEKSLLS